jgi:hypothetical protein
MNFSKDLFVSYTHADNGKLEGQPLGWATRFHNTLDVPLFRQDKIVASDFLEIALFPSAPVNEGDVVFSEMNPSGRLREIRNEKSSGYPAYALVRIAGRPFTGSDDGA